MWKEDTIENVVERVSTGKTPPTSNAEYFNGDINWYTPQDILNTLQLNGSSRKVSSKAVSDKKAIIFDPNTLLITCIGNIGRLGLTTEHSSSNQQITGLKFKSFIDPRYAFYYFQSIQSQLENKANKAVVPILNNSSLKEIRIKYPDLKTQQEIARILEEADLARQKRKAANALTNQFLQSTFLSLFGNPSKNDKGWEIGTIRDIVTEVKYGTSKPAEEKGKYPYLRMNNIDYNGNWDFSSLKYINLEAAERNKYILKKGDVVFNRTNSKELVGKTAIYDRDDEMAIAGYLIRIRTNERANPYYLWAYLNSKHGKSILFAMCKNIVGMANINAQELQDISIQIPPLELQQKFATIVADTEALRQKQKQNEMELENLFQALLQKYFG